LNKHLCPWLSMLPSLCYGTVIKRSKRVDFKILEIITASYKGALLYFVEKGLCREKSEFVLFAKPTTKGRPSKRPFLTILLTEWESLSILQRQQGLKSILWEHFSHNKKQFGKYSLTVNYYNLDLNELTIKELSWRCCKNIHQ